MLRDLSRATATEICTLLGARTLTGDSPVEAALSMGPLPGCAFGFVEGAAGVWVLGPDDESDRWAVLVVDLPAAVDAALAGIERLGAPRPEVVGEWSLPVTEGDVINPLFERHYPDDVGSHGEGTAFTRHGPGSPLLRQGQPGSTPTTFVLVPSRQEWWVTWWDEVLGYEFAFGLLVVPASHPMEATLLARVA